MQEIQRQLKTLADLQHRLLPRHPPDVPGWRVAVHHAVGPWPGGDYYDFLPRADGRLVLFVGDVNDQGGPATALVAMTRVVMHSCPLNSGVAREPFCPVRGEIIQAPHIILGNLNRVLAENSLEEQCLTAFCAVLSPAEGTLHYANAGHPPPLWWRAARGRLEPVRDALGLPLGLEPGSAYHHRRLVLEPGDLLVCYSDGLTAAQSERGEIFGTDRLDEAVRELAPRGAEGVRTGLVARLDQFLGSQRPQDDVTLVVLQRWD
jgi:phosphoserine phosphatase RsbU/P